MTLYSSAIDIHVQSMLRPARWNVLHDHRLQITNEAQNCFVYVCVTLDYNEYHYSCTDSAVNINATLMCDIQVGYQVNHAVETYTCQTFASSQLNRGKALSYSTPIRKSTGKTDYVTEK